MGKYTKMPVDTFQNIQINAGIICTGFNPITGEATGQIGATTGGNQVSIVPTMSDYGEDIDNCPTGTMEMQQIDDWEVTASGTFVTVNSNAAKKLLAAADIDSNDATHIIPRRNIKVADFDDVWIIGDYSNVNTGENAGYVAVHLMNVINTGGFVWQTTNKGKGNFAYSYKAHFSMDAQDTVPAEIYIKGGNETPVPSISLDKHTIELEEEGTYTFNVTTVPASQSVTWTSEDTSVATVSGGVVTAVGAGNTIVRASITVDGVTYDDTCTVIVTANEG